MIRPRLPRWCRLLVVLVVLAVVGGVEQAAEVVAAPAELSQTPPSSQVAVASRSAGESSARLVETVELSPRLHELVIESEALGGETRARILLPSSFGSSDKRYPVLYLLHGAGGDYTRWTTGLPTESTTEELDLIVIMPDGGPTGFYSNWYNGGAFGPPAWETYHLEELRLLLEQRFRANGRYAISGHSMGGFGALSYASRHPDLFSAVIASSPASDNRFLEPVTPTVLTGLTAFQGSPPDALWGNFVRDEVRWRAHNPLDLAPNLEQTPIYLSVGNGLPGPLDSVTDPNFVPMAVLEGALYTMNVGYSNRFEQLGITPVGQDLGRPGSHIIEYAHAALERWLPEVVEILQSDPVDLSRSFTYRSAEDHFSVWGWTFEVERSEPAFLDIGVSGETVAVNGTGQLRIVTPAQYSPGSSYRLEIVGRGTVDVVADDLGRLSFDLDLAGTSAETYSAVYDEPGPRHGQPPLTATISSARGGERTPERTDRYGNTALKPEPARVEQGESTSAQRTASGAGSLPATGTDAPAGAGVALFMLAAVVRMLSTATNTRWPRRR